MPRGVACTDPTHVFRRAGGRSYCNTCKSLRQRERQQRGRVGIGVGPAGVSDQSIGLRGAWQTRRERYGKRGVSPEGQARQDEARRNLRIPRQTKCKRGHLLTPENVYVNSNGRMCRKCNLDRCRARYARITGKRPEWVTVGKVRVNLAAHDTYFLEKARRLYSAMVNAHPDKRLHGNGGFSRFLQERKRWESFYREEAAWYKAAGVEMPEGYKSEVAA